MGSMGLPAKDSTDIRLDLMTPAEHLAQTDANSTEWSGALNKEQYFRREAHLGNQEMTRDGRWTTWALVWQPNGAETRQVLAGCETYAKRGLVKRKDGSVEDGVIHGVGSVFCPPEFRGQGYAGRMMRDLGERLGTWQAEKGEEAICSVLYSDIGKKFYAARGWQAFPSAHVALPAARDAANKVPGLPEVKLLRAEDLPELCKLDEQLVRRRLEKPTPDNKNKPAVALLPNSATMQWHHAREDFVAKELFGKTPQIKGAVVGPPGERVWCYWTRVFTNPAKEPPVMHILRLVVEDERVEEFSSASASTNGTDSQSATTTTSKAIAALFAAAQEQAAEWIMKEVQLWNPSLESMEAARLLDEGVQIVEREEESIASLRWYGPGRWEEVEWRENEKFGWC